MTDPREALARTIFDAGARCGSTNALCPCEEWEQSPMCRVIVRGYSDAILADGWTPPSVKPSVEDVARQQVADLRRSFSRAIERTAKRIERMGRTVSTELAAGLVREMVQPVALNEPGRVMDERHCKTCVCGCTCGFGGEHVEDNPRCALTTKEPR